MLQKCAMLVAAAGVVMTVACGQTDAGITTNVKTKFAVDDTVKAYQINVDTRNGVVTLTGDVDTPEAKVVAVRIVRETEGVRDVIDQIRVTETTATGGFDIDDRARQEGREAADKAGELADRAGAAISDAALTTTIKSKFLVDDMVKGLQIDVDSKAGVVALNGTVSSRAEADRAVMLARNTEGVTHVVDNLRVGR